MQSPRCLPRHSKLNALLAALADPQQLAQRLALALDRRRHVDAQGFREPLGRLLLAARRHAGDEAQAAAVADAELGLAVAVLVGCLLLGWLLFFCGVCVCVGVEVFFFSDQRARTHRH